MLKRIKEAIGLGSSEEEEEEDEEDDLVRTYEQITGSPPVQVTKGNGATITGPSVSGRTGSPTGTQETLEVQLKQAFCSHPSIEEVEVEITNAQTTGYDITIFMVDSLSIHEMSEAKDFVAEGVRTVVPPSIHANFSFEVLPDRCEDCRSELWLNENTNEKFCPVCEHDLRNRGGI